MTSTMLQVANLEQLAPSVRRIIRAGQLGQITNPRLEDATYITEHRSYALHDVSERAAEVLASSDEDNAFGNRLGEELKLANEHAHLGLDRLVEGTTFRIWQRTHGTRYDLVARMEGPEETLTLISDQQISPGGRVDEHLRRVASMAYTGLAEYVRMVVHDQQFSPKGIRP